MSRSRQLLADIIWHRLEQWTVIDRFVSASVCKCLLRTVCHCLIVILKHRLELEADMGQIYAYKSANFCRCLPNGNWALVKITYTFCTLLFTFEYFIIYIDVLM